MNVNQAEMPAELAATATSSRLETYREHPAGAADEILRQADQHGTAVERGAVM
jgi:hypothetical protein